MQQGVQQGGSFDENAVDPKGQGVARQSAGWNTAQDRCGQRPKSWGKTENGGIRTVMKLAHLLMIVVLLGLALVITLYGGDDGDSGPLPANAASNGTFGGNLATTQVEQDFTETFTATLTVGSPLKNSKLRSRGLARLGENTSMNRLSDTVTLSAIGHTTGTPLRPVQSRVGRCQADIWTGYRWHRADHTLLRSRQLLYPCWRESARVH